MFFAHQMNNISIQQDLPQERHLPSANCDDKQREQITSRTMLPTGNGKECIVDYKVQEHRGSNSIKSRYMQNDTFVCYPLHLNAAKLDKMSLRILLHTKTAAQVFRLFSFEQLRQLGWIGIP